MKRAVLFIGLSLCSGAAAVDFDGSPAERSGSAAIAEFAAQAVASRRGHTLAATSLPAYSQTELDELRAKVRSLFECWYVKRDQNGFWEFLAEGSLILKEMRKEVEGWPGPFAGAFVPRPDPGTLRIRADNVIWDTRERPVPILNDPSQDNFILSPGRAYLQHGMTLRPAEIRNVIRMMGLPRGEFMAVVYHVSGDGYNHEALSLFWAKQGGQWRLFGMLGFD